jgi:hypothetical protein
LLIRFTKEGKILADDAGKIGQENAHELGTYLVENGKIKVVFTDDKQKATWVIKSLTDDKLTLLSEDGNGKSQTQECKRVKK